MTPDEYLKIQEQNKKLYEVSSDKKYLLAMIEAERSFLEGNTDPIKIEQTISGQQLHFSVNSPLKRKPDPESEDPHSIEVAYSIEVACEKITPANLFDKVSAKDMRGNSVDLRDLLKDEQSRQAICDCLNAVMKYQLQQELEELGNGADIQPLEDDTHFGFKQPIEPKALVASIMERAQNFADPQRQQNLGEQHKEGPESDMELEDYSSKRPA